MITTKNVTATTASLASILAPVASVSADENTEKVDLSKTISLDEFESRQNAKTENTSTDTTPVDTTTDYTVTEGHVTKWVDEDGKPLKPTEDGSHPDTNKDAIEGRQLIEIKKDDNGDLVNVYKNLDIEEDTTESDELLLTPAGKTLNDALKKGTKVKDQKDTTPSSSKSDSAPSASKDDKAPSAKTKADSEQAKAKETLDAQLKRLNDDINTINELSPGTFSENEIKEMNEKFPNLSADKREEFLNNLEKTITDIKAQKGTEAPAEQPAQQAPAQPAQPAQPAPTQQTATPAQQESAPAVPLNSNRQASSDTLPSTGENTNAQLVTAGGVLTLSAAGLIALARRKKEE